MRRKLWSSPSWKAWTAGLATFIVGVGLGLIRDSVGNIAVLAATAAGVVAYAVLVHEQVREARRALREQSTANVRQEERSQKQISQTREQMKLDSQRIRVEAEQWRQAEERSKRAQLDALMPALEIRPVSNGLYHPKSPDELLSIDKSVSFDSRDKSPAIVWQVTLKLCVHGSAPILIHYDGVPGEYQLHSDGDDDFSRQGAALLNPSEPETLIWRHRANPLIWANYLRDKFPGSNGNWMSFNFSVRNLASTVSDKYQLYLRPRSMQLDSSKLVINFKNVRREQPTFGQLVDRSYRFMNEADPPTGNDTEAE